VRFILRARFSRNIKAFPVLSKLIVEIVESNSLG
jgi:hypothetical protein